MKYLLFKEVWKMSNKRVPVLTTKDLRKTAWRWMPMAINTFNYEGQMNSTVVYSLTPALRKIYPNDDEFVEALNNHFKYFNAMPWLAEILLGATLAMEDKQGIGAKDAVQALKTGLMGPISGIGDTIFWVLIPTIMGSIAGYMALEGSPVGAILYLLLNIAFIFMRTRLFELGYKSGVKIITDFGDRLNAFTESASILGLCVVGALIPTVAAVKTPLSFKTGEVVMEIQPLLDKILPGLIPVVLTFIVYQLLTKKNVKLTTVILLIIVLSMACSFFGLLA